MKKIVLAEDNPFIVNIYTTKLKQAGFEVKVIEDGEEVLKHLKKEKPDFLLLDIVLPTLNGWEILKEIRQTESLKNLPVIILSNLYQKHEIEKGFEYGVIKYMIKAHYTPAEVVEEIIKNI